jgi:maltooligosyltrehalose trehalohydrolase
MRAGRFPLGAVYQGEGKTAFQVWAPEKEKVQLRMAGPQERDLDLTKTDNGYHRAVVEGVEPGARYFFRIDGKDLPDPVSRYQPEGVHGPSEVVDPEFVWEDVAWFGWPLSQYTVYELHVGTFTAEGTFDAIIPELPALLEMGITAIELMPVAQFPGERNWGYDGVYPFAAQNSYGGPSGLKRLVNASHRLGLAVILDVVYNHLGPEGNYLEAFGPYYSEGYKTPWGKALNFDGPHSDHVRRFFLENALYWQTEFHIDALRLDAVHAIRDFSAVPFLRELSALTRRQSDRLNRRFHLIAESDLNNPIFVLPETSNGHGLDAQWNDDFHHALHVSITGEQEGYYADYRGVDVLAKVLRDGYAYTGAYSEARRQRHGSPPVLNHFRQFVVCAQNHDQVGNRMLGDRLTALAPFEGLKLAAAAVVLSPFVPMLFMVEEYGETAPFQYFVSHSDPDLVEAVRKGRAEEFAAFKWQGEVPDPQAEETFLRCRLNRELLRQPRHRKLRDFYTELFRIRRELEPIANAEREWIETREDEETSTITTRYRYDREEVFLILCFAREPVRPALRLPPGQWTRILDSSDERWDGPGSTVPVEVMSDGKWHCDLVPFSALAFLKAGREMMRC